jgi:hypothetical protein
VDFDDALHDDDRHALLFIIVAGGCSDAAAIRHLAGAADLAHARSAMIELGALSR